MNENSFIKSKNTQKISKENNKKAYSIEDALEEFEDLKKIALSCVDKNGNPNIQAALRAIENKAKIAGLYSSKNSLEIKNVVQMNEISIDGEQLKLNIGEDYIE